MDPKKRNIIDRNSPQKQYHEVLLIKVSVQLKTLEIHGENNPEEFRYFVDVSGLESRKSFAGGAATEKQKNK